VSAPSAYAALSQDTVNLVGANDPGATAAIETAYAELLAAVTSGDISGLPAIIARLKAAAPTVDIGTVLTSMLKDLASDALAAGVNAQGFANFLSAVATAEPSVDVAEVTDAAVAAGYSAADLQTVGSVTPPAAGAAAAGDAAADDEDDGDDGEDPSVSPN